MIVPVLVIAVPIVQLVVLLAPSAAVLTALRLRTANVLLVVQCFLVDPTQIAAQESLRNEVVAQVYERSAALVIMVISLFLRMAMPL